MYIQSTQCLWWWLNFLAHEWQSSLSAASIYILQYTKRRSHNSQNMLDDRVGSLCAFNLIFIGCIHLHKIRRNHDIDSSNQFLVVVCSWIPVYAKWVQYNSTLYVHIYKTNRIVSSSNTMEKKRKHTSKRKPKKKLCTYPP